MTTIVDSTPTPIPPVEKICFFSSDARPLYKRDVFLALTYPNEFVAHFRYNPRHVPEDYAEMNGKNGLIFLSTGNTLTPSANPTTKKNICIREVTILSAEQTDDTGLVHFYLQVGNFCSTEFDPLAQTNMPPTKFVSKLFVKQTQKADWHDIIDSIKSSFPNELFYRFKVKRELKKDKCHEFLKKIREFVGIKAKEFGIEFDEIDKQSFYRLNDEEDYYLETAFYDTEVNESNNYHNLRIKSLNDQLISVSSPEIIKIESRKDNRVYKIFTKSISSSSTNTYLTFETLTETVDSQNQKQLQSNTDTVLKIEIEKNTCRVLMFAFWSLVAAVAIGYGKILTDKISLDGDFNLKLTLQLILDAGLGFISAMYLFKFFDKK